MGSSVFNVSNVFIQVLMTWPFQTVMERRVFYVGTRALCALIEWHDRPGRPSVRVLTKSRALACPVLGGRPGRPLGNSHTFE